MGIATKGTATRTESLLRPREIQVRIRAGESPESVAAAAQTSVERVMAFATPVLAERAFVAQQAAKASVRRRGGDGPVGLLGDAVAARLESAGADPETVDWDAWRREDGRWTVVAQYADTDDAAATQRAEFTYDAIGRYVIAEDDPARWLVGERRSAQPSRDPSSAAPVPAPVAAPAPAPIAAVPAPARSEEPADELGGQLALGDDALRVVTGRSSTPVTDLAEEPTEDLTEVARSVRAAGLSTPATTPEPAVEPLLRLTARPTDQPAAQPADQRTAQPTPLQVPAVAVPEQAAAAADEAAGDGLFEDAGLRTSPELAAERRQPTAPARSRSRRSMPSWDDIMLGSAPRSE